MRGVNFISEKLEDILSIIKAIANEKRLEVLNFLVMGEQSFDALKKKTRLQKTALANHLNKLIESALIEKPIHGIYKITSDGQLFLTVIEKAYKQSNFLRKKQLSGQFSKVFVKSFFGSA